MSITSWIHVMEMNPKPKSRFLYSLTNNLGREKGDNFELLKIRIQDLKILLHETFF